MPKKMKKQGNPTVHEELSGYDIKINPFGELESNLNIDEINEFLNKKVEDKKLVSNEEE